MPQPILYIAITNHGFGHATRTAAVAAEIKRRRPDTVLILATTAPRWLLESYISDDFIYRPIALDIGVVQSDSITMNKPATLEKLKDIRASANRTIAREVGFIRQNRVGLVLADIPPLAAPIARAADLPCWMISNFGWDFIYRPWGGEFEAMADWIAQCFAQCDRLYRLPFHEPMSAFPTVVDAGLTGGSPKYDLDHTRQKFGITAPIDRTVLLTFGGLGLAEIPYHNLKQFPDWQFLTFDRQAPDLLNLIKINNPSYRPVDVMPLCDRVVSKPGFSTFAEACRLGVPIVTLTREEFSEAAMLLQGIQTYAHHQILSPQEFFAGDWNFLTLSPNPPASPTPVATDGNETIAQAVIDYLNA